MAKPWMKEHCVACEFRDTRSLCREGPPRIVAVPGAPQSAIVPAGMPGKSRVNITLMAAYPPVPPNHPACAKFEKVETKGDQNALVN